WLSPQGPGWWTGIVAHTHPGHAGFTASLPTFVAPFALGALAALRYRRRRRPLPLRPRAPRAADALADRDEGRRGGCPARSRPGAARRAGALASQLVDVGLRDRERRCEPTDGR